MTRSTQALWNLHKIKDCYVRLDRSMQAECLNWLNQTNGTNKNSNHQFNQCNEPNATNEQNDRPVGQTQMKQTQKPALLAHRTGRRASIASTSMFAIGNEVVEAGFDHFRRIPISQQVHLAIPDNSYKTDANTESPKTSTDPNRNKKTND